MNRGAKHELWTPQLIQCSRKPNEGDSQRRAASESWTQLCKEIWSVLYAAAQCKRTKAVAVGCRVVYKQSTLQISNYPRSSSWRVTLRIFAPCTEPPVTTAADVTWCVRIAVNDLVRLSETPSHGHSCFMLQCRSHCLWPSVHCRSAR